MKVTAGPVVRHSDGRIPKVGDYRGTEQRAWDEITGLDLGPEEVMRPRKIEIDYARTKNVWTRSQE